MASRSSSGMGVLVALVIFILLSMALLLTTMLFYTKQQKALAQQKQAETDLSLYVKAAEKNRDDIKRIAADAERDNASVVTFLKQQQDSIMRRVGGSPNLTLNDLTAQARALGIDEGESLIEEIKQLRQELSVAEENARVLAEERDVAKAIAEEQTSRSEDLETSHQRTVDELNVRIDEIQAQADSYRRQVEQAEQQMDDRVADIRNRYEQEITDLTRRLETEQGNSAQLADAVQSLQERLKTVNVGIGSEDALVDGEIIRTLENNEVFVNLGRRDHVVLGMTFEVYGSAADIRPNAAGEVPRGKATVELVRINDNVSTARVIRSTAGRAVVEGDVLVNAIYDRNKEYSFFVFGDFDITGDSSAGDRDNEVIESRIREWGGAIRDEFSGDIDFLVLGVAPEKPGPLRPGATPPEVRNWIAEQKNYEQYQEYLERARDLSIPVLNQNRLLTLIGYYNQ
ncbi:MAG: hypothetical protein ACF8PN_15420 [Phycisphaerales bacterium]